MRDREDLLAVRWSRRAKKNVKSTLVRAISANFLLNIKSAWNLNLVICKCFIFAFYLIFSAVLSSATTDVSKLWQEVGNDAKCGIQRETNKNLILIVQCLCESWSPLWNNFCLTIKFDIIEWNEITWSLKMFCSTFPTSALTT